MNNIHGIFCALRCPLGDFASTFDMINESGDLSGVWHVTNSIYLGVKADLNKDANVLQQQRFCSSVTAFWGMFG